jgi:ADP-ribose pyrophosphatase
MHRHPDVEILRSARLHHGQIFDLLHETVRLPSGLEQSLDVIEHAGAVCVAAVREDGRMLLVRQYRHAVGEWLTEIPAGRLEPGEDPLVAARRELEEETGHRAGSWELRARFYPAPGFCSELLHLFVARDLRVVPGGGRPHDHDEELEVLHATPEEALQLTRDAKSLLAAALLSVPARGPGPPGS